MPRRPPPGPGSRAGRAVCSFRGCIELRHDPTCDWKADAAGGIVDAAFRDHEIAPARARFLVQPLERGSAPVGGKAGEIDARYARSLRRILELCRLPPIHLF